VGKHLHKSCNTQGLGFDRDLVARYKVERPEVPLLCSVMQ
jgi:hypothetical protein